MTEQKKDFVRYTVVFKCGYRVIDNTTGNFLTGRMFMSSTRKSGPRC
jgi:hypothetical protein